MKSGLFWAIVREVTVQGGTALALLGLAVFLTPSDFGVIALVAALLSLLNILSDLGFAAALVQRADLSEQHLTSAYLLNIAFGALLCACGSLAAWLLASSLNLPVLDEIIPAVSLSVLLSSLSLVPQALARRQMRFRALALRDGTSVILAGAAAVLVAWMGHGIWAFVTMVVVRATVSTGLMWFVVPWRPSLSAFRWSAVHELLPYSFAIVAHSAMKWALQSADKIFLGYLFGTHMLGFYSFADKLVISPTTSLRNAGGNYFFPLFSSLQADIGAVRDAFIKANRIFSYILYPVSAFVGVMAPIFVPLIFGEKWNASIPVVQIFAAVVFAQTLMGPVGELMKALNRPRWLLYWTLSLTFTQWGAMLVAARWNLVGVALAMLFANLAFLPTVVWIARRLVAPSFSDIVGAIAPGLAVAGVVLVTCVPFTFLPVAHSGLWLACAIFLSFFAWLGILWVIDPAGIRGVAYGLFPRWVRPG